MTSDNDSRSKYRLGIVPEEHKIHKNALVLFGRDFRDHPKGLAEWVKNAIDAAIIQGVPEDDQHVVLFFDVRRPKTKSVFYCVDFIGTTRDKIDKGFKQWFDPNASKVGAKDAARTKTFGGHGNGGKFYMLAGFARAAFITYHDELLNVFGIENGDYGYKDGYQDRPVSPEEAIAFAELDKIPLPEDVRARFAAGDVRFTVVKGEEPQHFSGRAEIDVIINKLRNHSQIRGILRRKPIWYAVAGARDVIRMRPEEIPARTGFEGPYVYEVPAQLDWEGDLLDLTLEGRYEPGQLRLYTSNFPLRGEKAALNCVDILGQIGCLASHPVSDLGWMTAQEETPFIYGECMAPALEDAETGSVTNDRSRLARNPYSQALLEWIREKVEALAVDMRKAAAAQVRRKDLDVTAKLNEFLNRFTGRFMDSVFVDAGPAQPATHGTHGGDGRRGAGGDPQFKKESHPRNPPSASDPGGKDSARRPRGPLVLLSGYDDDPLNPGAGTLVLPSREHAIYQRPQDVAAGIYWINTARQMAERIIDTFGVPSPNWRQYLLNQHGKIIVKDAIYNLEQHQPNLSAEDVDNKMEEVLNKFEDMAAAQLKSFLFDAEFDAEREAQNVPGIASA